MNAEIEIRPATGDDRERIRTVARETWHDTYDELASDTIDETVDEWYGDESLEDAFSKPGTAFLVAEKREARSASKRSSAERSSADHSSGQSPREDGAAAEKDGRVVGFTHGVVTEDEGDVLRMAVHPDHQGEGIGTALHERLREDLQDFNVERMRAIDLASNEGGRKFYEKQGFERAGEGEVEIGDEERKEVVYTLEL